jgi:hypothetical protein
LFEYFISFLCGSEGIIIWSDSDVACMAIALAVFKRQKEIYPWAKKWYKRKNIINESFMKLKV